MSKSVSRSVALALTLCIVFLSAVPAAFAEGKEPVGAIELRLNGDIAGLSSKDVDGFLEIKSGNVVYATRGDTVFIADYAGTAVDTAVRAGRTYFVYYHLTAADGYELPPDKGDVDLTVECGKGVSLLSYDVLSAKYADEDGVFIENYRALMIRAKVVVEGTFLERLVGSIWDLFLKIRAWSLY